MSESSQPKSNGADPTTTALARMKSQLAAANEIALLRAQHDQALAEARQATAVAEQAARAAQLPSGTATPTAGTLESDDAANFIAELAAYRALESAAAAACTAMAQAIGDAANVKLLIVDSLDIIGDDIQRLDTRAQLDDLKRRARKLITALDKAYEAAADWRSAAPADGEPPTAKGGLEAFDPGLLEAVDIASQVATTAAAPALAMASGTLSALADVAGYFKADVSIKGRTFDLKKGAVTAAYAGGLTKLNCHIAGAQLLAESAVIDDYSDLLNAARLLQQATGVVKQTLILPLETEIAAAAASDGDQAQQQRLQRVQQQLAPLQREVVAAELHLKEIDDFTTAVTAAGDDGSVLLRVAMRQALHDANFTHLLVADLAASGGETIIKQWLWSSPSRTFVGGATVSYTLLTTAGQIVAAGLKTATVSRRHPARSNLQRFWDWLTRNTQHAEFLTVGSDTVVN